MKKFLLVLALALPLLGACAQATPQVIYRNVEVTRVVVQTVVVIQKVAVEKLVYVTPRTTSTPLGPTATPAPTIDRMKADKRNGFYLVGVDIAPGVWRSTGTADGCYWATTTASGDIINNHFGMSGGTAYISSQAFQVEFSDCGTWTWLSS